MSFYPPFIPGSEYVTDGLISIFNSNTLGNLFTTNGNIGINNTSPTATLDISGDVKITSSISAATHVGSLVSSASLGASGITVGTLHATTITGGNIQLSGTISAATHVGSLFSSASLGASGITVGTLHATTITGANIQLSGTISTANIAASSLNSSNINTTNITASSCRVSNTLTATFNSNTLGNLFTTGGNVGIGTTSPSFTLDIPAGTVRTNRGIHFGATGTLTTYVAPSSTGSVYITNGYNDPNNRQLWIVDAGAGTANTSNVATRIIASPSLPIIDAVSTDGTTLKQIQVGNSSGIRLAGPADITGNIGMRGQYKSWVRSFDAFSNEYSLLYDLYDNTYWESVYLLAPGPTFIGLSKNGGLVYRNGGASTFNVLSDANMKRDIEVANYDRCLEIIKSIDLKRFRFDEDKLPELQKNGLGDDKYRLGFIAQEVQQVFPKSVTGTDVLNVSNDQMNYALYGATKKLITQIDNYQQRIQTLEQELQDIKTRLNNANIV